MTDRSLERKLHADYMKARRAKRIAAGLCATCPGKAREGVTSCQACADKVAAREAAERSSLKQNSRCVDCGATVGVGATSCRACLAKTAAKLREKRAEANASGLCAECKQRPKREGKALCQECSDKVVASQMARYEDRKSAGQCVACGEQPNNGKTLMCSPCREKTRGPAAAYKARHRERVLRDGVCTMCGSAGRRPDYLYCAECLIKAKVRRYARYGFTREHLESLGDECHICGSTKDLHVDHDHGGGTIRGLLCQLCNNGLGMFRDSPDLLNKAGAYLQRKPAHAKPDLKLVKA